MIMKYLIGRLINLCCLFCFWLHNRINEEKQETNDSEKYCDKHLLLTSLRKSTPEITEMKIWESQSVDPQPCLA